MSLDGTPPSDLSQDRLGDVPEFDRRSKAVVAFCGGLSICILIMSNVSSWTVLLVSGSTT